MTTTKPTRVIYIAGLSRGGSTILQRYLATHPEFVSIGESLFTISALTGREPSSPIYPCSCGRPRTDCEVWGPLLEPLKTASMESGHDLLMNRLRALVPDKILIDSSKEPDGIQRFYLQKARKGEIQLQVILLVRDVRSWASAIRKYRRFRSSFVLEAYRWMVATMKLLRLLRSTQIDSYCMSYESFVFNPVEQAEKLADWLGVENQFSDERLGDAATHELFGSPTVRFGASRDDRLVYDDVWLRDLGPALLGPLLAPPLLLNRHIHQSLAGRPLKLTPRKTESPAISANPARVL